MAIECGLLALLLSFLMSSQVVCTSNHTMYITPILVEPFINGIAPVPDIPMITGGICCFPFSDTTDDGEKQPTPDQDACGLATDGGPPPCTELPAWRRTAELVENASELCVGDVVRAR